MPLCLSFLYFACEEEDLLPTKGVFFLGIAIPSLQAGCALRKSITHIDLVGISHQVECGATLLVHLIIQQFKIGQSFISPT